MRKFLARNWYQILVHVVAFLFLIDANRGEDFSNENLWAWTGAMFFFTVAWLDRIMNGVEQLLDRPKDIKIYVSGSMTADEIAEAINKTLDNSRRRL